MTASLENSAVATGKGQFSFQSLRKAMPKNAQTTTQLHSSHTLVKWCLKFSKQDSAIYENCELPDVQAGFRKGRGTRDQISTIWWIIKKAREFQKNICFCFIGASLVAQRLKHLPGMRETRVWSLGREDPLEKEMATHSSTLAWRIPWREEPGGLQSMGSQRVGHDWATSLHFCFIDYTKAFDCVGHNKLWKTLTGTGIIDHLTCLLRKW